MTSTVAVLRASWGGRKGGGWRRRRKEIEDLRWAWSVREWSSVQPAPTHCWRTSVRGRAAPEGRREFTAYAFVSTHVYHYHCSLVMSVCQFVKLQWPSLSHWGHTPGLFSILPVYCIALIFCRSKFLQIAVFDNFIEKNLEYTVELLEAGDGAVPIFFVEIIIFMNGIECAKIAKI